MNSIPTKNQPIVAISSRIAYENSWLKIREDETLLLNGRNGLYGVVDTNDSVIVAALNDKQQVFLVFGYSYPTNTWSWQIPGGGGDDQPPEIAAARELFEETGISAQRCTEIGNLIVSCGLLKEHMAVVIARNLSKNERPEHADDVDTVSEGKFVSLSEAKNMVVSGDICDSQSISGLYLIESWLERHGN